MSSVEATIRQPQHEQPKPTPPPHPGKTEPEKKEPEPAPDEEKENKRESTATTVSMTAKQFQQIMQAVIFEARKPVLDERKMAQQKRMREQNQQLQKDQRQLLINRFRSCNHMQLPGSVLTGCSCIAWATQSDDKRRGTCQHCGTVFSPIREECVSDEIWKAYPIVVRVPTHPGGNINTIFQSA